MVQSHPDDPLEPPRGQFDVIGPRPALQTGPVEPEGERADVDAVARLQRGRPGEPPAVDERAVATLDILDEDAPLAVGVYFGVLTRQHLGVEVAIERRRYGLLIGLPADSQYIRVVRHRYGLAIESSIDREEMENCRRLGLLLVPHGTVDLCRAVGHLL